MPAASRLADRTLRVVLVDDHTVMRQGLRRSLVEAGLVVAAEAADGSGGVRRALETKPDVVVMDISMPNLDGIAATRRLLGADARQRVLMLTMHAEAGNVERALAAGAIGYLTKDASTRDVLSAIEAVAHDEPAFSTAIERFVPSPPPPAGVGPTHVLGAREEELLQLIADGYATPEVAARMCISEKTVKNHLASIYDKLHARDRTHAVVTAVKLGIVRIG